MAVHPHQHTSTFIETKLDFRKRGILSKLQTYDTIFFFHDLISEKCFEEKKDVDSFIEIKADVTLLFTRSILIDNPKGISLYLKLGQTNSFLNMFI